MTEIKRDMTSFTGVLGAESFDKLGELKFANMGGGGVTPWHEYRSAWSKSARFEIEPTFPLQINFELNATCNLKCPMCPISLESNSDKKQFVFPFKIYKKVIDEGVSKGLKAIRLNHVNEPLLRNDLEEFIVYAKRKGILDIYLSTNGLLLTQQRAKSLIESGLDRIQISLDAFSESIYKEMRPGSNYTKVKGHILQLIELKKQMQSITPLIRVNFVRTEINEHELDDFIAFWRDKVDMIGAQEMIKIKTARDLKSHTTTKMKTFRCAYPNQLLVITAEGNVLPCCTFHADTMPLGNLFKEIEKDSNFSLEIFWNHKDVQKLRILHKQGAYKNHAICKKCVEDSQY
ncbi:radical SAM/SPASM domain-containing protein [Helicobacter trogontum]|nr:radical SAM/SPASM domain-containing protein [Helicobacter trogontum]MDY5184628.1 radical SAM/SPASM domain-containing protein [Helicobacter trogontum]